MINTLYQSKTGEYQKKNAVLSIIALIDNGTTKKVGKVTINLSNFVEKSLFNEFITIAECGDKKAKVCVSVKGKIVTDNVSDNTSEASGNSAASIGSEDLSNSLFREQDLGLEEEKSKSIVLNNKKPPIPRKGSESKILDIKVIEPEENTRYADIKASNSLLEKENQQLKIEKEDLILQIKHKNEESIKERENYFFLSNKLDLQIESLKSENSKLTTKLKNKKEKLAKALKDYQDLSEDNEKLKKNFSSFEKVKFLDDLKTSKKLIQDLKEKEIKLAKDLEYALNDKEISDNSREQMQDLNLKYKSEIVTLKKTIKEQQEFFLSKVPDDQLNYKKKIEGIVNDLKSEIKDLANERDEGLGKQTQMISEIQRLKRDLLLKEDKLQDVIRKFNFQLEEKSLEIENLNERLEEEIKNSKKLERKTFTEKEELDGKLKKLNNKVSNLANQKEAVEKSLKEQEKTFLRNRSETEPSLLEKLQKSVNLYQSEVQRLKGIIAKKDKENNDLNEKVFELENELLLINKIETAPESDKDALFTEQIKILKEKIKVMTSAFDTEKDKLNEKIKESEKKLELSVQNAKEAQKRYESQISNLKVEIISLQHNETKPNSVEYVTDMKEESLTQLIEMKKIENKELKSLLLNLREELKASEKKYMNLKVGQANFDLEKENIIKQYRDAQEMLKQCSENYNLIEIEFYRINEKFGQTLNSNNQLENENQILKSQIYQLLHRKKR